jgi:hypothetical protein
MIDQVFFVSLKDGTWGYSHHEGHFGPFNSKAEAMGAAVAAASEAGRRFGGARVMAMDEDGHIYTAWTYGMDASAFVLK